MTAAAEVLCAEAQLVVRDIPAACDFYVERMGFTLAFVYGEPPFYAQVRRGGARLNLRQVDGGVRAKGPATGETDLLAATIVVDGVNPLAAEFADRGVALAQPPRTEPWGSRTFMVRDPDANLILFASES